MWTWVRTAFPFIQVQILDARIIKFVLTANAGFLSSSWTTKSFDENILDVIRDETNLLYTFQYSLY